MARRSAKRAADDRDGNFSFACDEVFRGEGIRVIRTPIRAPQANAFAERFVGTVRAECLDWLLIVGRRHLEHVLRIYVTPLQPRAAACGARARAAGSNQPTRLTSHNNDRTPRSTRRTHPQIPRCRRNPRLETLTALGPRLLSENRRPAGSARRRVQKVGARRSSGRKPRCALKDDPERLDALVVEPADRQPSALLPSTSWRTPAISSNFTRRNPSRGAWRTRRRPVVLITRNRARAGSLRRLRLRARGLTRPPPRCRPRPTCLHRR